MPRKPTKRVELRITCVTGLVVRERIASFEEWRDQANEPIDGALVGVREATEGDWTEQDELVRAGSGRGDLLLRVVDLAAARGADPAVELALAVAELQRRDLEPLDRVVARPRSARWKESLRSR
jgi:hypothetical protein